MCVCTPEVRTPFCGKPGCERPKPEGTRVVVDEAKQLEQKLEDHLESQERAEREERVLTRDEARAQICRSVAQVLAQSAEETRAELMKAVKAGQNGVAEKSAALLVLAAEQLKQEMLATARKLDRPRILKPTRSMKVVRP